MRRLKGLRARDIALLAIIGLMLMGLFSLYRG